MTYITVFLLLIAAAPHQTEFNNAMQIFAEHYNDQIFQGECIQSECLPISGPGSMFRKSFGGKDSLVIGDTPGETLFISGNYDILMDVYIINDGVILLRNANLSIKGNITLVNQGTFDCDSSEVHFLQDYIYHFIMFIADSSTFIMRNTTTTFNGFPINLLTIGNAYLLWENLDNKDFTTAVVMGNSVDSLRNVSMAGEWLLTDNSLTSFKNSGTLLVWFFFPDSSIVDFTFPDGDTLNGFVFDSTLGTVSGLAYHTEIDSCTNVMWGMIPLSGSDVTIRDSEIRTTGLMFNSDSSSVSGLVNGITYNDFILPLQDRIYHLINTYVNTWSFYPADSSYLEVHSCIFGEALGMGDANYLIQSAFCDGSGGHIETTDNSFGLIFLSSMMCDVITKYHSVLVVGYSSILLGNIWATGSSVMALINVSIPDVPEVFDTSLVFIDAVTGPSTANTYEVIPVIGSATVLSGPFHPADFDYYELFYRAVGETIWVPFDSTHYLPVYNGTLGFWNTEGLEPGYYELRCQLFDTFGNNLEALKTVNLLPGSVEETNARKPGRSGSFSLLVNRKTITFKNFCSDGIVSLYDVAGRCMRKTSVKKNQNIVWLLRGSGIYFVRFETETKLFTEKAVLY